MLVFPILDPGSDATRPDHRFDVKKSFRAIPTRWFGAKDLMALLEIIEVDGMAGLFRTIFQIPNAWRTPLPKAQKGPSTNYVPGP